MTTVRLERFEEVVRRTRSQFADLQQTADGNCARAADLLSALPSHRDELDASIREFHQPIRELKRVEKELRSARTNAFRRLEAASWKLQYVKWLLALARARKRLVQELSWRTHLARVQALWRRFWD